MFKNIKTKRVFKINFYKKKKLKTLNKNKAYLKFFNKNSEKNYKKLLFFIKTLLEKKLNILIIGDKKISELLNFIFKIKNTENIQKYKNILFYCGDWLPGLITTRGNFYKKLIKKKINLIIVLEPKKIQETYLQEFFKLNVPTVFLTKYKQLYFNHVSEVVYSIFFKKTCSIGFELVFLIHFIKLFFLEKNVPTQNSKYNKTVKVLHKKKKMLKTRKKFLNK